MNETLVQVQRAIDLAERRLFDEVPLSVMAREAGASPWHFHRVFQGITGETPAGYLRRRRLSEICRRLIETQEAIVDVALACGFESQASFTRAFTRHIGTSPGRYRREKRFSPAHLYPPLDLAALDARLRRNRMEPRIASKPAFHVVGMSGHFTPATHTRIPELWSRFAARIATVPQRRGGHTLGICVDADLPEAAEVGFTYIAAVEVERIGDVPAEMIALTVPARTYAVYTHSGHLSRLHDTVKQIWGRWLPASPHKHVHAPDFEWYDERFDLATGNGEIDIYVPIEE